jgi:hypothetical protein
MNPGKIPEGAPMGYCRGLSDDHYISPDAACFPLRLPPDVKADGTGLFPTDAPHANLSSTAREYLSDLRISDPDGDSAGLIWMHALAISFSPVYLAENADGVRRDWPRIPLPPSHQSLVASAALGEQIAALLDTETDVPGVTVGKISPLLKAVGLIAKVGGGQLDTAGASLAVNVGWGHRGKEGRIMPSTGRLIDRPFEDVELKAIDAEAAARGATASDLQRLLGDTTCDVFLSSTAYWRNIPKGVWEYYIGGYQVIKKWLSYREDEILGRSLRPEEAREVMNMARRITALILLQPKLDENYGTVKESTYKWPTT